MKGQHMADTQNNDEQRQTAGADSGASNGGAAGASSGQTDGSAQRLTDQLRGQASTQISGQKERVVRGLTSVVEAVRETGKQLRDKQQSGIAGYLDGAANQIERFSQGVSQKEVGEIVDDVQRFAQRQPALFLGLGFGIGLLGARFLKSSKLTPQTHWKNSEPPLRGMGNSYRPSAVDAPSRPSTGPSAGYGSAAPAGLTGSRGYPDAVTQLGTRIGERRESLDQVSGRRRASSPAEHDPSFQER
jgi:hypothetical protein